MYFMVASRLSGSGRRDRPHPYDVRRWSVSTASVASSLLLLRPCQQQAPDALTLTAGRHEDLGQLARQSPGPDRMTRIPPDGRRGSLVAVAIGSQLRQLWRGWLRLHITGMAFSYILLLTAFYVDNGPHLPLWRSLPPLAHWLLPSLVGFPILGWVLRRHPLVLRTRALP